MGGAVRRQLMDFWTVFGLVPVLMGFVGGVTARRFKYRWAVGLALVVLGVGALAVVPDPDSFEPLVAAIASVGLGIGLFTALLWPRWWVFIIVLLPLEVFLIGMGAWGLAAAMACRAGNCL